MCVQRQRVSSFGDIFASSPGSWYGRGDVNHSDGEKTFKVYTGTKHCRKWWS